MQKWRLINKPGLVLKLHSSWSILESKQVQVKLNSIQVSHSTFGKPISSGMQSSFSTKNIWQSILIIIV